MTEYQTIAELRGYGITSTHEALDLIIKYGDKSVDMLDAGKSVDDVVKALKSY